MECALADMENARPMPVIMNPQDARVRAISDGDPVVVFNARGRCCARARVSDHIRERVVAISTGAWFDPDDHDTDRQGNPNVLTRDIAHRPGMLGAHDPGWRDSTGRPTPPRAIYMRLRYGTGSPCDIANQPNSPTSSSGAAAGQPPIRIRTSAKDGILNLNAE